MANTLDLVGDGDDVDIIMEVQSAFGVAIGDREAAGCLTVGDVHRLLTEKLGADYEKRSVCLSAVSFYRLRRALQEISGLRRIMPKTRLDHVIGARQFGPILKKLQEQTGLMMPYCELGPLASSVLLLLAFTSPVAAIAFAPSMGYWTVSWLLGWLLIGPLYNIADQFPPGDCPDVGSFAKRVAGLNYGLLSAEFGVCHPDDVMNALVEVIRDTVGFTDPIDYETTFFAPSD